MMRLAIYGIVWWSQVTRVTALGMKIGDKGEGGSITGLSTPDVMARASAAASGKQSVKPVSHRERGNP